MRTNLTHFSPTLSEVHFERALVQESVPNPKSHTVYTGLLLIPSYNSVMSTTFFLLVFSFFGAVFSAYPNYGYHVRDNQPPAFPVQQAPQYLVYPHGVYQLTRVPNTTYPIKGPDFVFGHRLPQDKLLLHSTVYKRPGIWSSYASKEITFPPPGSAMRVNITQVNAHDRGANATGGFVKLVRGGVGRENVTLLFRSQKNRPINFELDVYGVPKR